MANYTKAFTREETKKIIGFLNQIGDDRGPGIDLIVTVECQGRTPITGQLAFSEDDPRSFSIVRSEEPPGNVHEDVAWDEVVRISVGWG